MRKVSAFVVCTVMSAVCLLGDSTTHAAQDVPASQGIPISSVLRPDGRLDLAKGVTGALDVRGYRLATAAGGEPRFVPSAGSSALASIPTGASRGPESDPVDAYWNDRFGPLGPAGAVYASAVDASGRLYIGGDIQAAVTTTASRVAMWDGTNWSALGAGVNGTVRALATSGNDLFVGGDFTTAGGLSANRVAKWDGSAWSPLGGGTNASVYALAASGTDVYAGGAFTMAGGAPAEHVAKWNGSSWAPMGNGLSSGAGSACICRGLAISGSYVCAGGNFSSSGAVSIPGLVRWNGSDWSAIPSAPHISNVYALAVSGNIICAGTQSTLYKFDGTSWTTPGAFNNVLYGIALSGTDVYVGGAFTTVSSVSAPFIAKWNGSAWSSPGGGMDWIVNTVCVGGTNVYAGGSFRRAGGVGAENVAAWNGSAWSSLGGADGLSQAAKVNALAQSGDDVYAGGTFNYANGMVANSIAKWDGSSWSTLGGGMGLSMGNPEIMALAVSGNDLYAGGFFASAGGVSVGNVARWNGSSWSALGSGGTGGPVFTVAVDVTNVYVGGYFDSAGGVSANNIAKWDGTTWTALGSGTDDLVYALAVSGSDLYVGGIFQMAGGQPARCIAKWDGASWSEVGNGVRNSLMPGLSYVKSLAVSGSAVYVGGLFDTVDTGTSASCIAKWNGSSWSALGSGTIGTVYAIAVSGSDVYAGGAFMTAGGFFAKRIARWDGTAWSALGTGLNSPAFALAVNRNSLFVGGEFTEAGGKGSVRFAEWQPRVNLSTASLAASPGAVIIGDDSHGFCKPAVITGPGTTVSYSGGLPVTLSLDRADEIRVGQKRVNGAFTLSPSGVRFEGPGATLRIEFSEDDVLAHAGAVYTNFRPARLVYPPDYPSNKEAAGVVFLGNDEPVLVRSENGRQIYAVTCPISEINSTYGAVPLPRSGARDWTLFE